MDRATAYALLGLQPGASAIAVRNGYLARVKLVHPDRVEEGLRDEAGSLLAQLNEARQVAMEAVAQARRKQSNNGTAPRDRAESAESAPTAREPNDRECELCGTSPADGLIVRTVTGLLIVWKYTRIDWRVCRECGRALTSEAQARCLSRGWWGLLLAPIANVVVLALNVGAALSHRHRTEGRILRAPEIVSPQTAPLRRRSAWRPSSVLATITAAIIITSVIVSEVNRQSAANTSWAPAKPGDCVTAAGARVDCNDKMSAFVLITEVSAAVECPQYMTVFTESSTGNIFCAAATPH